MIFQTTKTQKLTLTAMFISLSIVIGLFSVSVPIGGFTLLRINFNGAFLDIIPVLFGPFYGGIAYFVNDIVSYMIKPTGAFMWQMTLSAVLKGVMVGFLFRYFKVFFDKINNKYSLILTICATLIISNLFQTSLNTLILKQYFDLTEKTIWSVYAMRLFKELFIIVLDIFMLNILLKVIKRLFSRSDIFDEKS